jgi:CheY-like chemotaxis protein
MSHELRTPLNAILGFAQLLEMDSLPAEQSESVAHILKGGQHLLELINEVLDISRIEAGRLTLSPEPVHVGRVLQEALDLITPLAAQRAIRVGGDLGDTDYYVLADLQRLKQVLLNLLSNAVKYNNPGGSVAVSREQVPGDRLRISVRDTGRGIPPEKMSQLFVPFARLGAEQTGVEGTGMGLALSKGLVDVMGGEIGAESVVGQGSTFWVELPLAESQLQRAQRMWQESPPASEDGARSVSAGTVLSIEDDLANLELLQRILADRPQIKLLAAMQGRMGLDLARQHRPDLILLDVHLPDLPGEEVLRRLQADPLTRTIPVVIISADPTSGHERLLAIGARGFLSKPIDIKQLLRTLDESLRGTGARHAGRPT